MIFKSKTQPCCRYCGGKIRKVTDYHTFWSNRWQERIDPTYTAGDTHRLTEAVVLPQTREEAQRLLNEPIVSVSYRYARDGDKRLGIEKVTTWDGESYEDEFFCSGAHAKAFAYLMARNGHCTLAYMDATGGRSGE